MKTATKYLLTVTILFIMALGIAQTADRFGSWEAYINAGMYSLPK